VSGVGTGSQTGAFSVCDPATQEKIHWLLSMLSLAKASAPRGDHTMIAEIVSYVACTLGILICCWILFGRTTHWRRLKTREPWGEERSKRGRM
jgi:hypothetical protein